MRSWFPFSDYEFYAYITAGMVLVAAVDYSFTGSTLVGRQDWTIVGGVFWAAVCYLVGQILASPSAAFLEFVVTRRIFRSPVNIILGLQAPRFRERLITALFGIREYEPFPRQMREAVNQKLSAALGCSAGDSINGEAAFQIAFPHARSVPDTAARLDSFINQYGLCRNVSFACLVAAILLTIKSRTSPTAETGWLLAGSIILAVGLYVRFLKYYAAYSREVFRTYNKTTAP